MSKRRFASRNAKRQKGGKPDTFDFLGFTHYCGKSQDGRFRVQRKTSAKKARAKLKDCKEWLKANRTTDIHKVIERLQRSLRGYYNYYCITDNSPHVSNFRYNVRRLFFKWMNRRSQKKSFSFHRFGLFLRRYPLFLVPGTHSIPNINIRQTLVPGTRSIWNIHICRLLRREGSLRS